MISFEHFKAEESGPGGAFAPIYLQIVGYVKRGIADGSITDGDELPSRRMLSALLGINPMTIQKAYRTLEDEGLVVSHAGAKSVVRIGADTVSDLRRELTDGEIRAAILTLKRTGMPLDEAKQLIETYWSEEEP